MKKFKKKIIQVKAMQATSPDSGTTTWWDKTLEVISCGCFSSNPPQSFVVARVEMEQDTVSQSKKAPTLGSLPPIVNTAPLPPPPGPPPSINNTDDIEKNVEITAPEVPTEEEPPKEVTVEHLVSPGSETVAIAISFSVLKHFDRARPTVRGFTDVAPF